MEPKGTKAGSKFQMNRDAEMKVNGIVLSQSKSSREKEFKL